MGDRANVYVKGHQDEPGVYLYSHWGGAEIPGLVQAALKLGWRWNDHAYLTRIIFDRMTEGCQGEEAGFGISGWPCDGQERVIEIDCQAQTVSMRDRDRSWTFDEFASLPAVGWDVDDDLPL